MKNGKEMTMQEMYSRVDELERRLEESEQLIEAIKAGEVDAFAISNGDESEIYTLQSADYTYRLLIEEFGEGALNVSEEGLILYANPYLYQLLKEPNNKLIGTSIFDFVHPDSKEEFRKLFAASLTGKSKGEVNLIVHEEIKAVYVSLTSLRPSLATVGMIITDFSEKKKTEKIILDYQNSLESKNIELVRNNEDLASFVYIASHDLQEPLRKIQTFASRLLEKEIENLSENGRDNFERMQVAARRMQTLIDDLLVYSRTNNVERVFEDVDLNEIIEEVFASLKEEIQEHHATIELGEICHVRVIAFQFRQLLYNLISNSLKFSDPDRPPHITIKCDTKLGSELNYPKLIPEKEYCHISISDNGIGFEQQYSEKIFNIFMRLHGRAEYSGTGIGLAIVKKIVENHQGIVIANSEPDKGATFDIYIPGI